MRYRNRLGRLSAVGVVMALLLVACGGDADEEPTDDTPEETEDDTSDDTEDDAEDDAEEGEDSEEADPAASSPAVDTDTIVVGAAAEIATPFLARYTNISPDINSTQSFWDTLVRRGRDGLPEANIATDWSVSEDGLTWTVNVRDDVVFHNGDPLTAEDVAFSILTYGSEDFGAAVTQYWAGVTGANVVDDYTVEFTLEEPNGLFMHSGTRAPIIPKDYYEEVGDEAFAAAPVTSGPYKFVEWIPDDRLVLEAFDDYWGGRPEITNVIIRPIPEEASRTAALRAGEVDLIYNLSLDQVELVEEDPALVVKDSAGIERQFVFMDPTRPPFDDVRVRQAVNYAINVPELVDELMLGFSEQIPAMTVPLEPGHNPDLEPYPYDPDRARELMEEAGYGDGVTVGYTIRSGYQKGEEVGQAIAGYLAEIGITTETTIADPATYSELHTEGTITELGYSGWGGGGQFHGSHYYNITPRCEGGSPVWSGYYCDEEMDALIDEALQIWGTDQDRAIELIQQAEQRYYDNAGAGFLFVNTSVYGVKSSLNWEPHPDGGFYAQEASWG